VRRRRAGPAFRLFDGHAVLHSQIDEVDEDDRSAYDNARVGDEPDHRRRREERAEQRVRRGMSTRENGIASAVIDAGAVRFRPMALTAAAVIVGAGVILFDPIFQGLAISLLFGLASSTLLTVLVIPAIYIVLRDDEGSRTPDQASELRLLKAS
jgi:hypothetical protein